MDVDRCHPALEITFYVSVLQFCQGALPKSAQGKHRDDYPLPQIRQIEELGKFIRGGCTVLYDTLTAQGVGQDYRNPVDPVEGFDGLRVVVHPTRGEPAILKLGDVILQCLYV
ncbi:MAG: hypothetical protein KAV43_01955 [Hadesarchaea archaeon]|nr:hypothetical protein [Hadesarchaea archaeon]